jgi:hypothetical protein
VCTVSTVLNNRTEHNGICFKIPCRDEKANVDAVETVEEEKEVGTVVCTVSNQDRTAHNGIYIEIPCNDAEVDVDVEEVSVEMVIGSVEQDLS